MGWTPDRVVQTPRAASPRPNHPAPAVRVSAKEVPRAATRPPSETPRSPARHGYGSEARSWQSQGPIQRSASVPPRQRSQPEDGLGPRPIAPHKRPVREPTGKITESGSVSHHGVTPRARSVTEKVTDPLRRSSSTPRHYAGMATYDLNVMEANASHALGQDDEGFVFNENPSHARRVAESMSGIDASMAGVQAWHDDVCSNCMSKSQAFSGAFGSTSVQLGATCNGHVIGNSVTVEGESLAKPSVGEVVFHERPEQYSPRETFRGAYGSTSEEVTLKKQRERWTSLPNQRGVGPKPETVDRVVFGGHWAAKRSLTVAQLDLQQRKDVAATGEKDLTPPPHLLSPIPLSHPRRLGRTGLFPFGSHVAIALNPVQRGQY